MSTRQTRKFVSLLILILAVMVIAGSGATEKKRVKKSEELLGTWVNEDYESRAIATATLVYQPDGTFEQYTDVLRTLLEVDGTFTIEDKWTDSEKNLVYKVKWSYKIGTQEIIEFRLIKISDSGNTYEEVFDQRKYPTEIDPIDGTYRIRYRQ